MHPALPQETEPPGNWGRHPRPPADAAPVAAARGLHLTVRRGTKPPLPIAGRDNHRDRRAVQPPKSRCGSAGGAQRPAQPSPAGAEPPAGQPRFHRPRPQPRRAPHSPRRDGGPAPRHLPGEPGAGAPGPAPLPLRLVRPARPGSGGGGPGGAGARGCREGRPDGAGGAPGLLPSAGHLGRARAGAPTALRGPAGAAGAACELRPPPSRRCSLPGFQCFRAHRDFFQSFKRVPCIAFIFGSRSAGSASSKDDLNEQ